MNRRFFLTISGLAAASYFSSPLAGNSGKELFERQINNKKPNILFIIADDLDADMFNFRLEGKGKNLTPNIDRLAREGTILWGQYIASPVCTPSRYTCLTGRYASRADNEDFIRLTEKTGETLVTWNSKILPEDVTLPRLLKQAGYTTGMAGKNHTIQISEWTRIPLNADPNDEDTREQIKKNKELTQDAIKKVGFDYVAGIYDNNADQIGPAPLRVHNMDWVAKGGLDFLDSVGDKPFYLYFAPTLTHSPYDKERSWQADPLATPDGYLDKPLKVLPPRNSLPERLEQAGIKTDGKREMLLWLDDAIGALLKKLEEKKLLDNTIIFFFNDNGQEGKGSIYQSGTVAPSIVWSKNKFKCGHDNYVRVSNIDFAPTILDLAGIPIPKGIFDGKSFKPVLDGKIKQLHESLYFELGFTRGVLKGNWKYLALRYPPNANDLPFTKKKHKHMENVKLPEGNPPFGHLGGNDNEIKAIHTQPAYFDKDQLYDLSLDPHEQKNLANDPAYAKKLEEMKKVLQKYLDQLPGSFAELKLYITN